MIQLLTASLPFLPVTLLALVLLLLAPYVDEVGRRRIVALFAVGALGLVVLAIRSAGTDVTVPVVNAFPVGPDMKSTAIEIERVTAAGWQWPVVAAVFCALAALVVFGGLRLGSGAPAPAGHAALVATAFAVLRLLLEKNAAPQPLVWAVGGSIGLPILVAFVGFYAGCRQQGFPRFLLTVLLFALLQRAVLSGIGWFATMKHWGTHLDVNALTELNTPIGGHRHFGTDPVDKWVWAILVPQMGLWVVGTLVLGLVVGSAGWLLGRRR